MAPKKKEQKQAPPAGFGAGLVEHGGLADKLTQSIPKPATTINSILEPYLKELMTLGPEYGAEMQYLSPYLSGTPVTLKGLPAMSGDPTLAAAEKNVASTIANQPTPGFGNLAKMAKQYEGTIPYSQILQSVLEAGKNQILGYSTVPNLTNLAATAKADWPAQMQAVVPYLEKSIGYTGAGLPGTTQLGIQALQSPGGFPGGTNTQNPGSGTAPPGQGSYAPLVSPSVSPSGG